MNLTKNNRKILYLKIKWTRIDIKYWSNSINQLTIVTF